jgi:hypothetical protein
VPPQAAPFFGLLRKALTTRGGATGRDADGG